MGTPRVTHQTAKIWAYKKGVKDALDLVEKMRLDQRVPPYARNDDEAQIYFEALLSVRTAILKLYENPKL